MQAITIDGVEYDFESLSDSAKQNIVNLKFVADEIRRLTAQIAVYRTAEQNYTNALKEGLIKTNENVDK
tara:strand:+ start:599 stop:805 length:207 start_codon:yes stop_codon:yes gene_type:complete